MASSLGISKMKDSQQLRQAEKHDRPLLTIAIPTYNRARFLRELLTSLKDQIISEPSVELFISDNNSKDNTSEVIAEFETQGLRLRYKRQPENIGADANFLTCFEQSNGIYLWIIGDDDIIIPGGINAILNKLRGQNYDLVYINSFPLKDMKCPPVPHKLNTIEFTDVRKMVKRVHVYFSFISGNIVNKDRLMRRSEGDFRSLLESNLVQLGWIYAALNSFECGLYIQDRIVGARVDNTGGYKLTEVFGTRLKKISTERLQSQALAKLVLNGSLQRFWPGILLTYRRTSSSFNDDPAIALALTSTFQDLPKYWIFVYPILIFPHMLGSAWFLAIRIFNWFDRQLGYLI